MALVSRDLYRNWWDDIDLFHRDIDDHFKRLTTRDDLWLTPSIPSYSRLLRPWRTWFDRLDQQVGVATVERDRDNYRVIVDVHQFAPEEITVKTDDKYITIEGKHEEKRGRESFLSKNFFRRYAVPIGYDISRVRPNLSSDGYLTVNVPRHTLPPSWERTVPIQRTYLPAIKAS